MGRKVFLSYAREDKQFAFELADFLIERGYQVWVDRDISGGKEWRPEIERALDDATDIVVILTAASAESEWVGREVTLAEGKQKVIHPIVTKQLGGLQLPLWAQAPQHHDFHTKEFDVAFDALCKSLGEIDPIQELLDHRLQVYQNTGGLIGEDDLRRIETNRANLDIIPQAEELIQKSKAMQVQRSSLFSGKALLGGVMLGLWLALYYFLAIGLDNNYQSLEIAIILFANFLPGAVAGVLFVLLINTMEKSIGLPDKSFIMRSSISGAAIFGGMILVQAIFMNPLGDTWISLLRGLAGALWGVCIGAGVGLIRKKKVGLFPAVLGFALISGLVFGGIEWLSALMAVGRSVVWIMVLIGSLPLLLMTMIFEFWGES